MPRKSDTTGYVCPCCKRHQFVKVDGNEHEHFIDGHHQYRRTRECVRDETKMASKTGCGHEWETWERDIPAELGGVLRQGVPPEANPVQPCRRVVTLIEAIPEAWSENIYADTAG